jgi:ABC-2 type transport system ATP-binding protein
LLSSHLLSEVEQMCSRVAILNQGRLVFNGQWAQLAGDKSRFRIAVDDWPKAAACATSFGATITEQGVISLDPGAEIATLVESLVRAGVRISAVEPLRPTLEQLYLETISAA